MLLFTKRKLKLKNRKNCNRKICKNWNETETEKKKWKTKLKLKKYSQLKSHCQNPLHENQGRTGQPGFSWRMAVKWCVRASMHACVHEREREREFCIFRKFREVLSSLLTLFGFQTKTALLVLLVSMHVVSCRVLSLWRIIYQVHFQKQDYDSLIAYDTIQHEK